MAAETIGVDLDEIWLVIFQYPLSCPLHSVNHSQYIVSIQSFVSDTISFGPVMDGGSSYHPIAGGAHSIVVVLHKEEDGKIPYRGKIHHFMDAAPAGGAVSEYGHCNIRDILSLKGEGTSTGKGDAGSYYSG